MKKQKDRERLRKLMVYILKRQPDEFGLVLDDQGFVRLKDFLKAITEEPGWGYVRKSHLQEVLLSPGDSPFVIEENKIRASPHPVQLSSGEETVPPKVLYHCVRRRAYPVVCEQGIRPAGSKRVFLATTEALAIRIGKRRDPNPVLLTVHAKKAFEEGVKFLRHGDLMYAADHIPVDFFSGPPLPAEKKKEPSKKITEPVVPPQLLSGSVIFDPNRSEALFRQHRKEKGAKKKIGWKEEARRLRRRRRQNEVEGK